MPGFHRRVYSITFSPNSQTLASGSEDNGVRLWDIRTGRMSCARCGPWASCSRSSRRKPRNFWRRWPRGRPMPFSPTKPRLRSNG
ncbi:MAG: hypothetical protein K2R98_06610 [Gemmataceae bacterium]|nr:hypothetical protein [Gemmataceae bacterium]